jgi:nitrogen fixation NifU-like protein
MNPGAPSGEDMYREHILDHYKHPRNFGVLKPAQVDHEANNPLCGDQIRLTFNVGADDTITDVKFSGRGCAISQASASLLTSRVKGKPLAEIKGIDRDAVVQMLGIPISPVRLKCALLSLAVLREGVEIYEKTLPGGGGGAPPPPPTTPSRTSTAGSGRSRRSSACRRSR